MKRGLALASAVVALAGGVALRQSAASAGEAVRPSVPATDLLRKAYPAAAREALGRRVLVLQADPGKPRVAEILESGRAPEGWTLYPAEAPATTSEPRRFGAWLGALAAASGAAFDRDRGVAEPLLPALALFGVKAVVVDDAGKGAQALTVLRDAEPVLRVNARTAAAPAPGAPDPVALAAALAATPGRAADGWTWSDWSDELWGGAVTVQTERPGRFVFPYPADGGHVRVNGAAAGGAPGFPLLVLDLPAGTSRVEVAFTERRAGEILAVLGAAGLVAGVIGFLLAIRTTPVSE